MKVAIIGCGKVGSVLALLLANNHKIENLILINRTKEKAEGLKLDLMGTYPQEGQRIVIGEYKDANDADIIFLTCGTSGAPTGTSLFDVNKKIIENVMKEIKPKREAKIVLTTTPIDELALIVKKLSRLEGKNIIGFGGQLDVNRLKYLIYKDKNDFSKKISVHFLGKHGASGIPSFREDVSDKNSIIDDSKNYFSRFLLSKNLKISTLGTSSELARLTDILINKEEENVDISYYNKEKDLFITWPCAVNKEGVLKPLSIEISEEEKKVLEELL